MSLPYEVILLAKKYTILQKHTHNAKKKKRPGKQTEEKHKVEELLVQNDNRSKSP